MFDITCVSRQLGFLLLPLIRLFARGKKTAKPQEKQNTSQVLQIFN